MLRNTSHQKGWSSKTSKNPCAEDGVSPVWYRKQRFHYPLKKKWTGDSFPEIVCQRKDHQFIAIAQKQRGIIQNSFVQA